MTHKFARAYGVPAPLRTLSSLPAPALVRYRYRPRQLLAVGTNAIRLAPGVGLRLSNDDPTVIRRASSIDLDQSPIDLRWLVSPARGEVII